VSARLVLASERMSTASTPSGTVPSAARVADEDPVGVMEQDRGALKRGRRCRQGPRDAAPRRHVDQLDGEL